MKINIVESKHKKDLLQINFLGSSLDKQLELAHKDYEKRKNEIITKLYTIWRNEDIPSVYRIWIRQAARFINEKEI